MIEELDVAAHEPTLDTEIKKVTENPGPMKMMFDANKPIANAPQGTIKVAKKSELIPLQGSPIPSDKNDLELLSLDENIYKESKNLLA